MLDSYANKVEQFLDTVLVGNNSAPLVEVMRYATLGGGKRIRAALTYATAETFEVNLEALDWAAAAVECIHAYSLIHDDLPAMDDDDFRRGKPSTHRAFDEAQAILAGDALNTFAFELLTKSPLSAEIKIKQVEYLARTVGKNGMVLGQSLDIFSTDKQITAEELLLIHQHKTADLISAAIYLAAVAADNFAEIAERVQKIAYSLGMAYQIADDISDCVKTSAELGKTAGKDLAQNKNTFVSFYGIDSSKKMLEEYKNKINTELEKLNIKNSPLHNLIEEIFRLIS
ncbi:MAG: polyprenyl synthetase family protein [Cardiobacteriaceae bacterium]|nr:polyprenyl synthetase family protein [Cardiobacteriaceae bacterium]